MATASQGPLNIEETGLQSSLLVDLLLKHIYLEGAMTLSIMADRIKLSPAIVHSLFRHIQKEQLCETKGMVGDDYEVALTSRGRGMAEVALVKGHYAGPAPVPLVDYRRVVARQAARIQVTAESLKAALHDLVLSDEVIKEVGTALTTGGAIFLYGSTGNGKTSIAERLRRVFNDLIYIPYAVEVAGQIITVLDPLVHRPTKDQPREADPRWVLCQRPLVKVGGELRASMLEPQLDENSRISVAPVQMKANNGILLIDDFGRQQISPRELLNRWIVPLDRHVDILSLLTGTSFEIPFQLLVVFATNLSFRDLAEDAFMRRIRNKIKIEAPSDDLFRQLVRRVCGEKRIPCLPEMETYLLAQCADHSTDGLRYCYAEDLTSIIAGMAAFERRPVTMGKDEIDRAIRAYFVH